MDRAVNKYKGKLVEVYEYGRKTTVKGYFTGGHELVYLQLYPFELMDGNKETVIYLTPKDVWQIRVCNEGEMIEDD